MLLVKVGVIVVSLIDSAFDESKVLLDALVIIILTQRHCVYACLIVQYNE